MNISAITQALKQHAATLSPTQAKITATQNTHGQAASRGARLALNTLPAGTLVKATVTDSINTTNDIRQQLIQAQFAQISAPHSKSSNNKGLQQQLSALPQNTAKLLSDPTLKMAKIQAGALQSWVFTSQPMKLGQKIRATITDSGQLLLQNHAANAPKNGSSNPKPQIMPSNIQHSTLMNSKLGSESHVKLNLSDTHTSNMVKATTQQRQAAVDALRGIISTLKPAGENLNNLTQLKKDIGTWLKSTQSTNQSTASDTLKPFLAKSITSLTQSMPILSHTMSHQHVQKAFNSNGMMLEQQLFQLSQLKSGSSSKLAQKVNIAAAIAQTDQKAISLTIAQHLSTSSVQPITARFSDQALQRLFKLLGLPQPNVDTLKKEGAAVKLLQQLSQLTFDNVNRIRSNQISQILKQVEASAEGIRNSSLSLEIPLRYNTTFIPLYVELLQKNYTEDEHASSDAGHEEEKPKKQSQWEVFLTLELKHIGKVSVCVKTLSESKHAPSIDTKLWIDDSHSFSLLNMHLPDLSAALEKDGFKKNTLTCVNQPPPVGKKQHIAANLIDITT